MVNKTYLRKIERLLFLAILSIATILTFGLSKSAVKAEEGTLLLDDERYQEPIAVLRELTDARFTSVTTKDLRGTGGELIYFVVEGDIGYAVCAMDGTIAELSAEDVSPYNGLDGDNLYYFGDGEYYLLEDGEFLHLTNGQTLSLEDAEVTMGVELNDSVAAQGEDDGVTYVTELTFPGVSFNSFIKVLNYELIYNKRTKWEFGYNQYGTCTGVAANIFLQYYSEIICPGVLPYANFPQLNNTNVYVSGVGSVSLDYATGDSIGEKQHKYIYNRIENSDSDVLVGAGMGACQTGMQSVINEANSGWSSTSVTLVGGDQTSFMSSARKTQLVNEIHNGHPVMGFIFMAKDDTTGVIMKEARHACVFYGYQVYQGKKYFLAHLGYETVEFGDEVTQEPYAAIISEDYLQDGFIYVTAPSTTHQLSLLHENGGGHLYKCLICGYQKEEHPLKISSYDSVSHNIVCDYCAYSETETHTISYNNKNSIFHIKRCTVCSYSVNEAHIYVHNNITGKNVCVCGRIDTSGGPGILSKNPGETE